MTKAQKALGYRIDPNALQFTQISTREQVDRDYRSGIDEFQFGNKRRTAPRRPVTHIDLNPVRR
jgi:hypothetical protein